MSTVLNPQDPAVKGVALPDATTTTPAPGSRAIYVGGAGSLVVTLAGDSSTITFTAVPAGTLLPIRITSISSSSTATDVVALY